MHLQKSDFDRIGWTPEELDEQVYLVRGALTSNECAELIAELESYNLQQWSESYIQGMREYSVREHGQPMEELIRAGVLSIDEEWVDKTIAIKNDDLIDRTNAKIEDLIRPYQDLEFRGVGNVQRQYEGAELKLHTDGDSEPSVVFAVIFYLNDDYTGGELYFPTRSLEVRPPAGSAMIFPTTSEYQHGVHPVGPGPVRYVLPSFIQLNQE